MEQHSQSPVPYRHEPLDLSKDQIRLFRLLPGVVNGVITGSLVVFDIGHAPSYSALSYTWGPKDPTHDILIDGMSFTVRDNLWHFLKVKSERATEDEWFWVDQICIDQDSSVERSHQVGRMAGIYQGAYEALIWLGPTTYSGTNVKETNELRDFRDHTSWSNRVKMDIVFQKDYWDRLWIIQELLLPEYLVVCCGNQTTGWESLAGKYLVDYGRRVTPHNEVLYRWAELPQNVRTLFHERHAYIYGSGGKAGEKLSYILDNFADRKCQDVRDKVYGLLSLVRRSGSIDVHYNKSATQVFFLALEKIVEDEPEMEPSSHVEVGLRLRNNMMLHDVTDQDISVFIEKAMGVQKIAQVTEKLPSTRPRKRLKSPYQKLLRRVGRFFSQRGEKLLQSPN